jgi:alkanesulfonate monooxygenase SsuD/methylene tetrahydromethanopterin reductase-like flavin-dependent oxidoreductase (luciferase family)
MAGRCVRAYPEAWTLLSAIGVSTQHVRVGSMVLAAGFRHPALIAKMATALQELTNGRLILGIGAGNQVAEHTAFGFDFDGRLTRLTEYVQILTGLLANEQVTFSGRYYSLKDASLLETGSHVPIWLGGAGPRMLSIVARNASGWNWIGPFGGTGGGFSVALARLRIECERIGRNPGELEISWLGNVLVQPDARATSQLIEEIGTATGWPTEKVREQYVIGTPEEVLARLQIALGQGVDHLICNLGGRGFTLWSEAMLELFAREVLPWLH